MSKELGTLVVVVLKARNLPDKHSFYKQDVFAQITLQGVTKKTQIDVKGGQHPVWDEELRFPVYDKGKEGMMMEVSCWSKEPRSNDLVGKGELDISETLRTGEFDDWIPLSIETTQRGDLYLEMTFFAAGPPPALSRRPSKMKPAERLWRPSQATPPRSHHASTSPRPTGDKPLPPLAEEPPAQSQSPPPEDIPAFLRPGAGKGRSPNHRASASLSASPYVPAQSPPLQGHRPSTSISSVSSVGAASLPAALRVGKGGSPTPISQSTYVPEAQIPRLPSETLGGAPAPSPQPTSAHNPYHYGTSRLYPSAAHTSPPPADRPIPALPPVSQPIVEHPPTPQPGWHTAQAAQPSPQRYSPPQAPYPQPPYAQTPQPQPPSQPYAHYNNSPPQTAPLQPSTQPAPVTLPGFAFPTPTVTPAPAPPASGPPSNNGYGYPYASYGQPPAPYGVPYGAPPPQAYGPPPQHAQRPYPYNYPPPPRDPDIDAPLLNSKRYQKPLPLPDEPDGVSTPTPAHPRGRVDSSANHRASGHRHTSSHTSVSPPAHHNKSSKEERTPEVSREERDRLVALQIEKEEEERRRIAREQEEKDAELARQLDLELNLNQEEGGGGNAERSESPNNGNNQGMPGSWHRIRV